MSVEAHLRKSCSQCGIEKELEAFNPDKRGRYGRHPRCKDCRNAYHRELYASDPAYRAGRNRWKQEHKRARHYYDHYGLKLEEVDALFSMQADAGCSICSVVPTGNERPLVIDHNHETGDIRGVLCRSCNLGIGNLKDDPALLRRAIEYLSLDPVLSARKLRKN